MRLIFDELNHYNKNVKRKVLPNKFKHKKSEPSASFEDIWEIGELIKIHEELPSTYSHINIVETSLTPKTKTFRADAYIEEGKRPKVWKSWWVEKCRDSLTGYHFTPPLTENKSAN